MTFSTTAFRNLSQRFGLFIFSLIFLAGCARPFQAPVKDIEQITKTVSPQKAETPLPVVKQDPTQTGGPSSAAGSPATSSVSLQGGTNPNTPTTGSSATGAGNDPKVDVTNITEAALAAGKAQGSAPVLSLVMGPTFSQNRSVACPAPYLESVGYMEGEGIKGWYNGGMIASTLTRITEGRSINPRRLCEGQTAYLGPLGRVKLNTDRVIQEVSELFHMDSKVLKSMDDACGEDVLKADSQTTDAAWARGYAIIAFAKKWAAFEDQLKIILSLRQQFDMQNPDSNFKAVNCDIFHSNSLKVYCQSLSSCLTPEQRAQAFAAKAHTLFQLIDARQSLKQQPSSNQSAQDAIAGIESLPFLKSEAMAKYVDSLDRQQPDENAVKEAMKKELNSQQAKLDERLITVNHAFDCLMGYTEKKCDKVESVYVGLMSDSPQRIPEPGLKSSADQKDLGQISQLQSCMANWAGEVRAVSEPWNAMGITLVTGFLPTPSKFAALGKAAQSLKGLLGAAALGTAVGGAKVAGALKMSSDAYNTCSDLSGQLSVNAKRFRAILQKNQKPMTCQSSVEQFDLSETSDWCGIHYALAFIPPATREALIGVKSLKYLQSLPIPNFLSKLRWIGSKYPVTAGKVFSEIDPAFASSKFYTSEVKTLLETDASQFTKMSELAEREGLPSNASADQVKTALRQLQSKYYTDYKPDLSEADFNLLSAVRSKLNSMNDAWKRIQAGAELPPAPATVPKIGAPSRLSTGE